MTSNQVLPRLNKAANDTVAILRAEAGRHPYDTRLSLTYTAEPGPPTQDRHSGDPGEQLGTRIRLGARIDDHIGDH